MDQQENTNTFVLTTKEFQQRTKSQKNKPKLILRHLAAVQNYNKKQILSLRKYNSMPTAENNSNTLNINPLNKPCFDFTKFTPITNINERHKYKAEFEKDYGEYLRLAAGIKDIVNRFRKYAARLQNVPCGGLEHFTIEDQIYNEYQRNEEILKRRLRYDYLHEKLSNIKLLVADFDKTMMEDEQVMSDVKQEQH